MSGAGAGDGRGQAGGDGGGGLLRGHGSGLAGDSRGLSSDGFRLASHDAERVGLGQVLSGRVVNSLLGWLAYVVLLVGWYDVLVLLTSTEALLWALARAMAERVVKTIEKRILMD